MISGPRVMLAPRAVAVFTLCAAMAGGCKPSTIDAPDAGAAPAPIAHPICMPGSVAPPTPTAERPPMPTGQGACSQAAARALFDACLRPGGDCAAWRQANAVCARCAFTPEGASVEGPFITRDSAPPKANQRGCLDSLAPGCGAAYESVTACTHAACDGNAGCGDAGVAALAACRQTAMRETCRPLMDVFVQKCGAGGLTDKRLCFPPEGGEVAVRDFMVALALRACGPKTGTDAGAP